MKPTFLLFHVESVNENSDAACHLILIPVVDGVQQEPKEYFFNPEAPFRCVMSGITEQQVASFPKFSELWPKVQDEFNKFDFAVCTAEGYSARTLSATLNRLNISSTSISYCNAKAICRRSMNEVAYSLDYLSYAKFNDWISSDDPIAIARRWCELALMGLSARDEATLPEFLKANRIAPGILSSKEFTPSLCLKDYSKRKEHKFDPSSITVDADPEHPLFGMNVVFTGKLEALKRDEARALVVKVGGMAPERLTTETDYLVVGVQDLKVVGEKGLSGKMKSAAKYKEKGFPIEIIDEHDFLDMIGEDNISLKKESTHSKNQSPFITISDVSNMTDDDIQKGLEALNKFRKEMGFDANCI